jgi:alkanesulfonate monooxygenase SsuD/methylene tetrahydromethanopterin reductase-like flavin-dependent oxidoreductase (luciferase family)
MSPDRRLAYDSIKPNVAVFLWTSYPDRNFVRRSGLTVPNKLEEIIAKRDYNLMLANAHLVPDEFVDKFCWAGTPEDVAKRIAPIAKMGISNFSFLPHPPRGESILYAVREMARTVKPMVEVMVNGA